MYTIITALFAHHKPSLPAHTQAPTPSFDLFAKRPNLKKTSVQVTKMDKTIKTIIIHVKPSTGAPHTPKISVTHSALSNRAVFVKERMRGGEEASHSRDILVSAMESDRISARSRKTRQRSLSTWMRGLISRYSRTAE